MSSLSRTNTVSDLLTQAAQKLQPKQITCAADKSIGRLEAEILLAHILRKDRVWLLAHGSEALKPTQISAFADAVRRRAKHEPAAYILGERDFYGRTFHVNTNVLIPRPETELIVEHVLGVLRGQSPSACIWDVGTGSGALGVTLALEAPSSSVIASDVSTPALIVARRNAKRLGAKQIRFIRANLLEKKISSVLSAESQRHDTLIITANLPYLPLSDKKKLDTDVVKYEPSSALFSGADGLDLITALLDRVAMTMHAWSFKRIILFIEFDPPQAPKLKKLAKTLFRGSDTRIIKDLAKRNRVLEITIQRPTR